MSTPSVEAKRVAGVIVTHGQLASELLAAAEMIIGPISHIAAVSIGWHDDVDAARDEVQRAITRVTQQRGVLLLTDMFGGTPTNIASMSNRTPRCCVTRVIARCKIGRAHV